eukprot:1599361-Alexandrium_andersonii.AAC.1
MQASTPGAPQQHHCCNNTTTATPQERAGVCSLARASRGLGTRPRMRERINKRAYTCAHGLAH